MRPQAKQFIELLVSKQLLAPEIVEELNRQVEESKSKLSPELIAKLLVDNGHLTKFQATKLIAEVREDHPVADDEAEEVEEELGFADEVNTDSEEGGVAEVFVDDDAVDVSAEDVVEVVADAEVEVQAVDVVTPVANSGSAEAIEVIEGAEIVEVVESVADIEDAEDADVIEDDYSGGFGGASTRAKRPNKKEPEKSAFDSFRIFGVGLILALVLVALVFLVRWFVVGNAEKRLEAAKDSYEGRQYPQAAEQYTDFYKSFPGHEQESFARVRAVLAELRNASEKIPDPTKGLEKALELLPGIASEDALTDDTQRSDLAGVLINLAGKFTQRADKSDTTAERKRLMDEMSKLLDLINDGRYVGKAQQKQQEPTLNRIFEDRKRILREIGRDEQLAAALVEIDELLAKKDVPGAYAVRKKLTSAYPLLVTNGQMRQRVAQASQIQQALAQPSDLVPEVIENPIEPEQGGRIVLANRFGDSAPSLAGRVITVRVKGSIYGIDGENGSVLWRKFIGRSFRSTPVPVSDQPGADVLVTDPEQGLISRVAAKTGDVAWSMRLGTQVFAPMVESEEVLAATFDGNVLSLDAAAGQVRWGTKLPQPIAAPPTAAFGRENVYVAAEHSNLYVLGRNNGDCRQVLYLDHAEGAIVVPPILFKGQLFVFENQTSEVARVRIFATNDDGLITGEAQRPFTIDGNIVVQPQLDSRRMIVQSDTGAIKVLDVEPTKETEQVSELAGVPPNALEPTAAWSVSSRNKLWVADKRLSRFDLSLAQQKLQRSWVTDEGDTFVGPMQLFGDILIHSRRLRGNRGVRVSAVNPDSGAPIWNVDIGVPVTFVSSGSQVDVVNSGGMMFAYDRQRVMDEADYNPGQGKPEMVFQDAVEFPGGTTVLLNASRSSQMAVYSETNRSLKLLTVGLQDETPSCQPVAVGDNLGVGLTNGQFLLISPVSGRRVGAPYQPELQPGQQVRWNRPVYLDGPKTLIVASDLGKIVRLGAGDSLRFLSEADLEAPMISPLCQLGGQVAGVVSNSDGDSLVIFNPTSLKPSPPKPLPGRWLAGPFPVENGCVVQADRGIVMFDQDGNPKWQADCAASPLVAAPAVIGQTLAAATQSGKLYAINRNDGSVVGSLNTRQDFTSAPVVRSKGVLIGSDEGAVLALQLPQTLMSEPEAE